MKLFQTDQLRELDSKTLEMENISSVTLMDRAALALFTRIRQEVKATEKVLIMAGPGNNGGDALAVARLLAEANYSVQTCCCTSEGKFSADAQIQLERLKGTPGSNLQLLDSATDLANVTDAGHIVDGLFGSGLNRPLAGFFAEVVQWINRQNAQKISIDLPSGLFGEDNRSNDPSAIVRADLVLGLQFPRLAFLLAENEPFIGTWELVDIAIHPQVIEEMPTHYAFTTMEEVRPLLKKRSLYAHKGTFGKVLLVAGSPEMTGAAVLSARGALRSGAGLLYVHIPSACVPVLQIAVPEALIQAVETYPAVTDLHAYSAIAIGPGIGIEKAQTTFLKKLLMQKPDKLVLDADALNLLSEQRSLLKIVPSGTILTPHPREFDRLTGSASASGYERLKKAVDFAMKYRVHLVLKGAYTACITPTGQCSFNSTGNPGMATGGSGDVLTGIIVSLLAQGYQPDKACRLGVFLHGLSGDIALESQSYESLMANDLVENLGRAFKQLEKGDLT
jgi:ADP-dependent NAD(P)H-hydrate dehydratase / NAD(P)H-hydrate epimerase